MSNSYHYEPELYNTDSASEIVPTLINLFNPVSVLDIGCGIGSWLNVFKSKNIKDIFGVDFSIYDKDKLITPDEYKQYNLNTKIDLGRRFDLALCLEVAEHLEPDSADIIVETLVNHSDVIIFSAAIPNQGGQNHLNEQWIEYWRDKFIEKNYHTFDIIRPLFWNNANVNWWYKQNMFVATKKSLNYPINQVYSKIHPEFFIENNAFINGGNLPTSKYLKLFLKSILNKF